MVYVDVTVLQIINTSKYLFKQVISSCRLSHLLFGFVGLKIKNECDI